MVTNKITINCKKLLIIIKRNEVVLQARNGHVIFGQIGLETPGNHVPPPIEKAA